MSEFKVGDNVRLEGTIVRVNSEYIGVQMRGDTDIVFNTITPAALAHAKLIRPEHDIEAHTHIPACKGTNCGSTTGMNHSPECEAEHIAAITGVPVENKVLDLSKPVRLIGGSEELEFIQLVTNGMIIIKWPSGSLDVLTPDEIENVPEPKRTASRDMVMVDDGMGTRPYILYDHMEFEEISFVGKVIARGTVTLTEGDGL